MATQIRQPIDLEQRFLERFTARFAPGAAVVHSSRSPQESPYGAARRLAQLGFSARQPDALPDLVLYDAVKHWLILVQLAESRPPMTPERVAELRAALANCDAHLTFISAFPDFDCLGEQLEQIAWHTEVWLAEAPDHLIHFNGERFLSPR